MAADSRKNAIFRERYWAGDIADAPSDGEFFIDSGNTNRITVFRGGVWVTPQFDAVTLTGTTTLTGVVAATASLTTAVIRTLTVSSLTTLQTAIIPAVASGMTINAGGLTVTAGGVTVAAGGAGITGVASIAGTLAVASAATFAQAVTVSAGGLTVTAGGVTLSAAQRIILGEVHVPTTAASLTGLVQIGAVTGGAAAPLNTGVPTTNSVFFTYDTGARAFAVNIAGSWYKGATMSIY